MRILYGTILFAFFLSLLALPLVTLTKAWWARRSVRVAFAVLVGAVVVALGTWTIGTAVGSGGAMRIGVQLSWSMLAIVVPLVFTVWTAGIVQRTLRAHTPAPRGEGVTRRAVIQWSTAALPAAALGASGVGLVSARRPPELRTIGMEIAGLAPELRGLRILHLTDVHLGHAWHLAHLEKFLDGAARERPDLVVLTGDISDDLAQLSPALSLIAALRPRLGVFAALGNHEYFRGVRAIRRAYDRAQVPLLVDEGAAVDVGARKIWIAGVDDPVAHDEPSEEALRASLDRALEGSPADAFRLILSHRPEGFVHAAASGAELTLSGHTHGVQVGAFGRSVFEPLAREHFLWGRYTRGKSSLYTSSGFGHWLPFRLGCAAEAPLIVLAG